VIQAGLKIKRVLLVEDSEGVREFVRSVLVAAGVVVTVARDGSEGLSVARADGYAFDLVITDIVMPGLYGPQMVDRLREARPDLPVLFMTGYADSASTREELRSEEELLEKPFSARALLDAIQTVSAKQLVEAEPAGQP
jgi:CheY-like chemotaxis protein